MKRNTKNIAMASKKKLTTAGLIVMVVFVGISFGFSNRVNPFDSGIERILVAGAIPALAAILGALTAALFGLTETVHDESK